MPHFSEDEEGVKKERKKTKQTNKGTKLLTTMVGKLSSTFEQFTSLVEKRTLTDSLLVDLTSVSLPVFFAEGLQLLQLSALALLSSVCSFGFFSLQIFARHADYRTLILDEIFHSLVKLPKAKRHLRNYK